MLKKITIVFFIYQLGAGGAARTFLNILNNIDQSKFRPVLVTLNYDGNYEAYLRSDVTFIKLHTKRLRSAIFPLAKLIRNEKADIVFSTIPNYNTIAILARLLSFTGAVNVVREAAYLGGTRKENIKLRIYGILYRFSKRVIALSEGVKDNITHRYKIKADKIAVIYNPVDVGGIQQRIKEEKIPANHEWLFNDDKKVLITAGRLVRDKDHTTLLQSFAKLNRDGNARLLVLGEGKLESELKLQAQQLGIDQDVHFLGFQQNPYMYFCRADVFVLSSIHEGFGHVLAEALAAGIPIVSTNARPGATEVLQNGEYGKLCETRNPDELTKAVQQVLSLNTKEIGEIVKKGQKRASAYNAEKIVRQYEAVFTQTVTDK